MVSRDSSEIDEAYPAGCAVRKRLLPFVGHWMSGIARAQLLRRLGHVSLPQSVRIYSFSTWVVDEVAARLFKYERSLLMKPENNFPRAFIDLARLGRTDWRSIGLTFLLVKFLAIFFSLVSVVALALPIFSEHRLLHIPDTDKVPVYAAAEAAASVFGFWLACRKILRRPFRSLISVDMTFNIRRCFLGGALYLAANVVSFLAVAIFALMRTGAWVIMPGHLEWPNQNDQVVESIGMLIVIPFMAFVEELFFRAWLTQTVGRYIRSVTTVVVLVSLIFAAYHTQYDWRGKALVMIAALGFSALSLRDQRLELAVGAHSMMNICATLHILFFTGPRLLAHTPAATFDWCVLLILKGALPFALMYLWLQKTGAWFAPTDACLVSRDDVQPARMGS